MCLVYFFCIGATPSAAQALLWVYTQGPGTLYPYVVQGEKENWLGQVQGPLVPYLRDFHSCPSTMFCFVWLCRSSGSALKPSDATDVQSQPKSAMKNLETNDGKACTLAFWPFSPTPNKLIFSFKLFWSHLVEFQEDLTN